MYYNEPMQKCAVLILSCDKYQDLWKSFFQQFWKNWPDCPYPVYLGSNTLSYSGDLKVKTILSGKDIDWSTSLLTILKQIPEEQILFWLDDLYLTDKVDNKSIEASFSFLNKVKGKHMHYRLNPHPDGLTENGTYGIYEKGAPYRVNTVGFWDKKALQSLVLPGESPWNFEIFGSYRSSYMEGFYCPMNKIFDYIHLVEKGSFFFEAVEYCKKHHIKLDTRKRKILMSENKFFSDVQAMYFNLISKIPWPIRLKAMWVMRKLFVSY